MSVPPGRRYLVVTGPSERALRTVVRRIFLFSVIVVIVLASCGPAGPASSRSASVSPSVPAAAATGSPASASASQNPAASSLACEIPFVSSSEITNRGDRIYSTGQGTAGFLKLPEGTFRPDPNGAVVLLPDQYHTVATPVLTGQYDTAPDRWWDDAAQRWLPVANQQIAPDGASYVYRLGPEIHLVTVATGADRVMFRQPSGFVAVWLVYRPDAVYFSINDNYKGGGGSIKSPPPDQVGLWKIDAAGGRVHRLVSSPVAGLMAGETTVWSVDNDSLVQKDVVSGKTDSWFSDPGRGMQLLGMDPVGNPLVWTYGAAPGAAQGGLLKMWRITGPNAALSFYSETYGGVPSVLGVNSQRGPVAVDSHGAWFGATTGLYLLDAGGFHRVAQAAGIPVGPCQ